MELTVVEIPYAWSSEKRRLQAQKLVLGTFSIPAGRIRRRELEDPRFPSKDGLYNCPRRK